MYGEAYTICRLIILQGRKKYLSKSEDLGKGEPVNTCVDVYKAKIQYDGSIEIFKLIIVTREDLKNKEIIEDTWSPKASTKTLKYFLGDSSKHKARVHQLYLIR